MITNYKNIHLPNNPGLTPKKDYNYESAHPVRECQPVGGCPVLEYMTIYKK